MKFIRKIGVMIVCALMVNGCATYKTQYASFRPAEEYANMQVDGGIKVGGEAYAGKEEAENAFGFDIKGAGLLPVQIVINNGSAKTLEIVSNQTFLVDTTNRYWSIIPNRDAVERIDKATETGTLAKGAGKGAALGAVGGAILGAAIGIVSGENIASAAGKGAALGAAGGAVVGGVKEGTSKDKEYRISDDIRDKGIEGKGIPAEGLANGFIFFPAEAPSAKELRLQMKERESGKIYKFTLKF
jgi:hypothetical protein